MVQERRRRRGVSWRCGKWIQFLNGGKNVPLMEVQNPNCYISALSYCSNNSDGWQLLHWRQQTREPCRHDIITTLVRWKRVAGVLSFLGFFFLSAELSFVFSVSGATVLSEAKPPCTCSSDLTFVFFCVELVIAAGKSLVCALTNRLL